MKTWDSYTNHIKRNCASPVTALKDLSYWRNNLFAGTIIYLLPFCLIALIPGLYLIIITGIYILGVADIVTVISMVIVAFVPGPAIHTRKVIFIASVYIFSCTMLYYLGMPGPGLVYLQATGIFFILIFPAKYAWWPAFLNTGICILFALAISFHMLPWPYDKENSTGQWIAVSTNMLFLSFLFSALIPRLFNGLQETIQNEKQLKEQLSHGQQSLQQAVEMLEQKNNELEQFAYIASHDLQEPLRMITGFLTQLKKKYNDVIDDKGKQYIHFAVDGAQRMRQIILDLLEFSRAGRTSDQPEDVDLNELIHEIRILFRNQIEEKNAIIQADPLPVISMHKAPVRQVFQNLISNALKYSKEGLLTQIGVSVQQSETYWQFTISDNGIGISPEYFDKIFIIFQRLHNKVEYPGTGLGLAICKKIIESHGGKIWIESEEGKGSTFYFTILKQVKTQI